MAEATNCVHPPLSPGQSMCKCEDIRMHLELLVELQSWQIARLERRLQGHTPLVMVLDEIEGFPV